MASPQQLRTPLTDLLKINHPVLLAGMNVAAGPKLAAAVTNAGGMGVIGGVGYTPEMLKDQIQELKSFLNDKNAPFGVDLLLPQVGGNARKTKDRPMRVRMNPYIQNWEENRAQEIKELTSKGVIPVEHDFENLGDDVDDDTLDNARPHLMGKAAAVVNEKKPAKAIVDELVSDAVAWLKKGNGMISKL
ncbi:hypothetical protein CISG_06571 [Coccidioides immitis RMSCC 3703]|uniref:Uncharacterized protein n=1 Tax=Coccidioides immitis RMSCC 3703 TaxID=454286 RepID=A0A0J8R1X0_COCIT|nr:hypothetical protein CISG_06571 [Coccidioides immitis RMSCC 3703]